MLTLWELDDVIIKPSDFALLQEVNVLNRPLEQLTCRFRWGIWSDSRLLFAEQYFLWNTGRSQTCDHKSATTKPRIEFSKRSEFAKRLCMEMCFFIALQHFLFIVVVQCGMRLPSPVVCHISHTTLISGRAMRLANYSTCAVCVLLLRREILRKWAQHSLRII